MFQSIDSVKGRGIIASVSPLFLVSVVMTVFGPDGYFWGLAGLFLPVTAYSLWRVITKARPIQRRFLNLPPRSSIAVALLAESEGDYHV